MPVTNYHTLNGELLGETGPGGRRFYGKDALGSVVATYDQNGTLENTYRYKPYGGLLSKTGSAPDPRFMWTGSTGSRTTGASYAEQYNRARHYGSRQAGWTSVDPLWPRQESYAYARSNPSLLSDPSGMVPPEPCRACRAGEASAWGILEGCGNLPKTGPCGRASSLGCELICRVYGTDLISVPESYTRNIGPISFSSCCCPCLCRCPDMDNGESCPAVGLEACAVQLMKHNLFPLNSFSSFTLGAAHANNGDTAKHCGFCSDGVHFQYHCHRRGGQQNKRIVTTAKCCRCREGGADRYKCSVKQCHEGSKVYH